MRKILLLLVSCLLCSHMEAEIPVYLSARRPDYTPIGGGPKKSPMAPLIIYIEDYTLFFDAGHPDYSLVLKDEEGEEVYSTVVYSSETEIYLPISLTGEILIEIACNNSIYVGYITL